MPHKVVVNLKSEQTAQEIEEHLSGCVDCMTAYYEVVFV